MEVSRITAQQINDARTERGGWSKAVLATWGVPWPPPKGWRKKLIRNGIPDPINNATLREKAGLFPQTADDHQRAVADALASWQERTSWMQEGGLKLLPAGSWGRHLADIMNDLIAEAYPDLAPHIRANQAAIESLRA